MKLGPVTPDLVKDAPDQQADQDISRIRGAWAKEHNPDGSHGTIQGSLSIVGNMTATAQPRVCLYATANQVIANATWTTVTWKAPQTLNGLVENAYDTDQMFISGSNWFSCKTAGVYIITAMLQYEASATGSRYLRLSLGKGRPVIRNSVRIGSAADIISLHLTHIFPLAIGDYFFLETWQNSLGNLNLASVSDQYNNISILKAA